MQKITQTELKCKLENLDKFHDELANLTDGTSPVIFIEDIGYITLVLEDDTGSTLIEFDGEDYSILECITLLQNLIKG